MLKVNNISFSYTDQSAITLKHINFCLNKGENLAIMGESGSGKSTLLKLIYGLLDPTEGQIFWNEVPVLGPKFNLVPGFENFKYVAQDFDLMPYTSVSENIKKFLSRFYPKEAQERTLELLQIIDMVKFADEKVKNLSGGQQQRVAIARALAKEPQLVLLDEPFSQIDNYKKNKLRRNIFNYLKKKNIACIIATHDGSDALSFADKMLVLKNNEIIADNNPREIYVNPKNTYVASLFDDINEFEIYGKKILKYPHQLEISANSDITAKCKQSYFKGTHWLIEVSYQNQSILIKHEKPIEIGKEIGFSIIEKI